MTDQRESCAVSIPDRIDLLFRVWRTDDGRERSHRAVADAMTATGIVRVSAEDVEDLRSGRRTASPALLTAFTEVFPSSRDYLLDETKAAAVHAQLLLLEELVTGGVNRIRLRGGQLAAEPAMLTSLLQKLRRRREQSSSIT